MILSTAGRMSRGEVVLIVGFTDLTLTFSSPPFYQVVAVDADHMSSVSSVKSGTSNLRDEKLCGAGQAYGPSVLQPVTDVKCSMYIYWWPTCTIRSCGIQNLLYFGMCNE